ncbi:unnamed protein product [Nezara viridula]|uniref:Uncharacterized protein n=1 Tax=Nezara viridula TaxID=85310 RepID=A0A9P0E4C5_NEZVI|nr:unnamed protein product [Nezara viridula]
MTSSLGKETRRQLAPYLRMDRMGINSIGFLRLNRCCASYGRIIWKNMMADSMNVLFIKISSRFIIQMIRRFVRNECKIIVSHNTVAE